MYHTHPVSLLCHEMSVIQTTYGPAIVVCALATLAWLAFAAPIASGRLKTHRRRVKLRLRHVRYQRRRAAARRREAVLERRARADCPESDWACDAFRRLVTDAFDPLQGRWRQHHAQQAQAYVSDAFYDRHRRELEQLQARHQTRRIVVLSLDDVEIVGLDGSASNDDRRVVARVRFRAYETLLDSRNARVIDGLARTPQALREDWTLVWHPTRGWLIDDIQRSRTQRTGGRSLARLLAALGVRGAPRGELRSGVALR